MRGGGGASTPPRRGGRRRAGAGGERLVGAAPAHRRAFRQALRGRAANPARCDRSGGAHRRG
ncbi:hypothetical protein EO238_27950, partial [Citrobacter sp. AAK_AS5]